MPTSEVMTSSTDVLISVEDGVGRLVLNRPERRNALSNAMIAGISSGLREFERRDDVGAVLITGAGGAFCAGGDLRQQTGLVGIEPTDLRQVEWQRTAQRETVGALYRFPKPVVAALPGAAAGAGLGLALAADLRIGTDRTLMSTAFAGVALSGDFGVAWFLHSMVGPAKARDLLFNSPKLRGRECFGLGLLDRMVEEEWFELESMAFARTLAEGPSYAYAAMKQNLLTAPDVDLETAMDFEVPFHRNGSKTRDHEIAVRAFLNKERPVFGPGWTGPTA